MSDREPSLSIKLTGPGVGERRLALADLVHVGRHVQAALERVALVLRGSTASLRPGRRPADIAALCRLDLVGFRDGSAILELDLAAAERPFAELDLGEAALDRLVGGLHQLSQTPALPSGWDAGVLLAWRELGSVFERGIDRIEMRRSGRGIRGVVEYTSAERDQIVRRIREPVRDLVTVEGRLLMADFGQSRRCRVEPPYGRPVPCIFRDDQREAVLDLLTKYVRVVGQGELDKEDGRLRNVVIADIEPIAVPGDQQGSDFWGHLPVDELAQRQGVGVVESVLELRADLWESDRELEEFLAETYRARERGPA
jgi:hypothetical protein